MQALKLKLVLVSVLLLQEISVGTSVSNRSAIDELTVCCPGTYVGSHRCQVCKAGTFSTFGSQSCTTCPSGSFADAESPRCLKCPAGTFAGGSGSSQCTPCPAGHFTDTAGNSECPKCPTGTYAPIEGSRKCSPCMAGTFTDREGSSQCSACPAGTYSGTEGASECEQCDPNFALARHPGLTKCDYCPDSATTDAEGFCFNKVPLQCSNSADAGSEACKRVTDSDLTTFGTIPAGSSARFYLPKRLRVASMTFWKKDGQSNFEIAFDRKIDCNNSTRTTKITSTNEYVRMFNFCYETRVSYFDVSASDSRSDAAVREIQLDTWNGLLLN